MKKIKAISGFPEWLPEQRLVEEAYIAKIKAVYESYGFTPIETSAVESIDVLAEQGVSDKEIYALRRLRADDEEDSKLGLHFDLTVPFSRYVAQNADKLKFPFRRYQLQKVWRGERPQKGRFREFYQFDADLVAHEHLPLSCDAELVCMFVRVFRALNLGAFKLSINNRKYVLAKLTELKVPEQAFKASLVAVDKLHKIGHEAVVLELIKAGLVAQQAEDLLAWSQQVIQVDDFIAKADTDKMSENAGLIELVELIRLIPPQARSEIYVDHSLVRGLDYYTGLIFEISLNNFPEFGSVSGGGRYDNLVSRFSNQKLPGVGGSVGLTRLMDLIFSNKLDVTIVSKQLPQLLVTVLSEQQRPACNLLAEQARSYGIPTEVFYKNQKLNKQLAYAAERKIPYVIFVPEHSNQEVQVEIKDMSAQNQFKVNDFLDWCKKYKNSVVNF